ncbi:Hypothetical predicted protein [Pelobates cultripes]|uniref:Uncharacterized protein n=1 Tax=Pelobates cultripes TaxID=61616 RepID=A0AAD1S052_PELCU|nr:Hypothetical predicted protein [Pelobates cultripes]
MEELTVATLQELMAKKGQDPAGLKKHKLIAALVNLDQDGSQSSANDPPPPGLPAPQMPFNELSEWDPQPEHHPVHCGFTLPKGAASIVTNLGISSGTVRCPDLEIQQPPELGKLLPQVLSPPTSPLCKQPP